MRTINKQILIFTSSFILFYVISVLFFSAEFQFVFLTLLSFLLLYHFFEIKIQKNKDKLYRERFGDGDIFIIPQLYIQINWNMNINPIKRFENSYASVPSILGNIADLKRFISLANL